MKGEIRISVRDLVEFVLRGGSIDNRFGGFDRAQEGSRIHRRLQKEAGEGYRAEVRMVHTLTYKGVSFTVEGRADGLFYEDGLLCVDEIKTTGAPLSYIDEDFNRLHWAQAQCYAYFSSREENLPAVAVRLTYFQVDTKEIKHFRRVFSAQELEEFFLGLLEGYMAWADFQTRWDLLRDESLAGLVFPFPAYRKGQREMAVGVYRTIQRGQELFCQAPTGIGKTVSALFPALKALGEGQIRRVFYLTARTITRKAAESALTLLRNQPLRLKSIVLTAKEKVCFQEKCLCNPDDCPFAAGHFDRVNAAILDILQEADDLSRENIEAFARKHRVCPFEFSLDLTLWCDVIICDYNYLFDPTVYLRRFFSEDGGPYAFLIDEAHNLVDRSREMYSAALDRKTLKEMYKALSAKAAGDKALKRACGKAVKLVDSLYKEMKEGEEELRVSREPFRDFEGVLNPILSRCEEWLQENRGSAVHDLILDSYFAILQYLRIGEGFDSHYHLMIERTGSALNINQFCTDPSALLAKALKKGRAAVFFSATLSPLSYYASILGGGENTRCLSLPSPFDPSKLGIFAADRISTKYKDREAGYPQIARMIYRTVSAKKGNYMVFFPSYAHCQAVYEEFLLLTEGEGIASVIQESGLTEEERETFLKRFEEDREGSFAAFCVMGGLFSEGIDLQGDLLIGTVIVGVGLPQLSAERDLIRGYFDEKGMDGFSYSYRYPGMNKVLQAAGRVIRSDRDRGVVLLIDERFSTYAYRQLFPSHWERVTRVRSEEELRQGLLAFWGKDLSE